LELATRIVFIPAPDTPIASDAEAYTGTRTAKQHRPPRAASLHGICALRLVRSD
jgi:hypothetical protein